MVLRFGVGTGGAGATIAVGYCNPQTTTRGRRGYDWKSVCPPSKEVLDEGQTVCDAEPGGLLVVHVGFRHVHGHLTPGGEALRIQQSGTEKS